MENKYEYTVFNKYKLVFVDDKEEWVYLSMKDSVLPKMFHQIYRKHGSFFKGNIDMHIEHVIKPYLINCIVMAKIKEIADNMIVKHNHLKIEYCKTNSIYIMNTKSGKVYRISDHDTYAQYDYKIFPVRFTVGQVIGAICTIIDIESSEN